jgi:hypothetical protein
MTQRYDEAREMFEWVLGAELSKEKWTSVIAKQAKRYSQNGGFFSMLEIMYLTSQIDKILLYGGQTQKEALLNLIEEIAQKAKGTQDTITQNWIDKKVKKRGGMLSWISFGYLNGAYLEEEDMVLAENRAIYLILKAAVLRALSPENIPTVIQLLDEIQIVQPYIDKLYHVMSLIEYGKCYVKTQPDTAAKYFQDVLKVSAFDWDDALKVISGYDIFLL